MANNNGNREGFASQLGFLLVSAGCAVGIGNVWKFPYMVGQNGGALFVILYIIFLVLMGIPVLSMELAIGRAGKSSGINALKAIEKKGSKWHLFGWVCLVDCYILMFYYTTVSGWMVEYFYKFVSGTFENVDSSGVSNVFSDMMASPVSMIFFTVLVAVTGFLVLCFGVQKGLERVSKFMMIGLLLLIIALAVNSIMLKGSSEGLKFYLLPDLDSVTAGNIGKTVTSAMSQAFFTLSIGMGVMLTLGSYMPKERSITGEAVRIAFLDTFVALIAGIIIFPACFSYNVAPDSGPSLIFVTLPQIFINMPGGRIWGALFFVFMIFASFSTVTAVFENIVAYFIDTIGWSRKKAIFVNIPVVIIGSLPCVLGFNILKDVHIFGDWDILTVEDFILSKILLPLGCIVIILFCALDKGWGFKNFLYESNTGDGMRFPSKIRAYITFVLPLMILLILVNEIFFA